MVFLKAIHLFALCAAWLNALPLLARLVLTVVIGVSLWRTRQQAAELSISSLQLKPDGSWRVRQGDSEHEAFLLDSSVVTPWFVLLHWRMAARRQALLLCRDSLEPDAFRRLRVALRVTSRQKPQDPFALS
jgi:hypothetical protein